MNIFGEITTIISEIEELKNKSQAEGIDFWDDDFMNGYYAGLDEAYGITKGIIERYARRNKDRLLEK